MADQQSLNTIVNECKTTLASAEKTIRELINQRSDALAAADPAAVYAARQERLAIVQSADLQAGLEQQRLATEAAISDAWNKPAISSTIGIKKPAAPTPVNG